MTARPAIALCIPAYNAAAFLPKLLNSARKQTIPFDEVWVYDDASTDATAAIASDWGAKVVHGDTNRGCSYGKNQLAEKTACDWIHFHDADDILKPDFVTAARVWMERPNPPDVVLFGVEFRDFETDALILKTVYDNAALRQDPLRYTISSMITSTCGIYRRTSFLQAGGYDLDPLVLYNEDTAMHCQLTRAGLRFAADPAIPIIGYRRHHSMSQDNQRRCFQAQYHVMRKAAAAPGCTSGDAIARRLWEIASASATWQDWDNVRACVALAQKVGGPYPPFPRWWMRLIGHLYPVAALRLRENLIRLFRPHLRRVSHA